VTKILQLITSLVF